MKASGNGGFVPPVRAKAQIGVAAFAHLRAAIGEDARGEPVRIALSDIDEDPGQPRRAFDPEELQGLAASIRERGVLQAIVVRPPRDGRYLLVMGARRLRASRLAGVADIPAIIRRAGDDDYAAQVIENRQRADLSNSDLADAVQRFVAEGRTTRQIGAICNLKDYQVAAFRKAGEFPPELRGRMDAADMRALYDLFRQWTRTPDEVIAALPDTDTFLSITEARRIIGAITGRATGSLVLDGHPGTSEPEGAGEDKAAAAALTPAGPTSVGDNQCSGPAPSPNGQGGPTRSPGILVGRSSQEAERPARDVVPRRAAPVFVVRLRDGTEGRLVVDRRAEREGHVLVRIGHAEVGVDPADLVLARVE